jgi:hypothetical protein
MIESTIQQPEFGNNPEDVTRFNEVLSAIKEHNDQFSLGAVMAKALIGHVKLQIKADQLTQDGLTPEEAEETAEFLAEEEVPLTEQQQMEREIVGIVNGDVLEAAGLTLSPVRKIATMFGPKGESKIGEVRLQLQSGDKFSGFLSAAPLESADEETTGNVVSVASDILSEMKAAIISGQSTPAVTEALAYAQGIAANLDRLPDADARLSQSFKDFSVHAATGDLTEWVHARQTGILTDPADQQFGPSQWQRDASSEFLAKRWQGVITTIKESQANPKASALTQELLDKAKANLALAQEDWHSIDNQGGYSGEYGTGFDDIFATIAMELDSLERR